MSLRVLMLLGATEAVPGVLFSGAMVRLAQLTGAAKINLSAWTWPISITFPLFVTGLLYLLGCIRRAQHATACAKLSPLPALAFASGWFSLLFALNSPLHEISEQLFWVHMTQHEILVLVAAPLLVLSRPLSVFLWGLPASWRQPFASLATHRPVKRIWSLLVSPMVAWTLHAAALWFWHAPVLFNQTLTSDAVHGLQHVSFLGTALLFWWALVYGHGGRSNYGASILYVFTTAVHTSVLGALLTFASRPWYAPYASSTMAWGLTPLQDQQIGGLIMWVPAGTVLIAIGLWMVPKWLKSADHRWDLSPSAEFIRANSGVAREN